MAHDFNELLFEPAIGELGVDATMNGVAITVFDETRAKVQGGSGVEVRSVGPAASARIPELTAKGIAREAYKGATLTFNDRTWEVRSYELQGSPNGEDRGLVRFLLMVTE